MTRNTAFAAATLLLATLAGCGSETADTTPANDASFTGSSLAPATGETLLTVNGAAITRGEFSQWLLRAGVARPADLSAKQRQVALDELASLNMLAQAAEQNGLAEKPTVIDQLVLQKKSLLADQYLEAELAKNPVSAAEVEAEYSRRKADMAITQYHARHIVVADQALAERLIGELNGGADFAALAKQYSIEASKNNGGDIGWFELREMVRPFADEILKLSTGTFSQQPVKSSQGWHIVKAEGRREVPAPALSEMQPQLRQLLRAQRVEQIIVRLRAQSRSSEAK